MATIVISYRREDSKWIADRIFDRFESHYGKGNVFMDIDSIPFGLDFRDHIRETLDRCDVMVALVGPNWIGRTRTGDHILNETDWVRIEVEAALKKKIPLIPLLIDGSQMPKSDELPDSLKNFVFRQAAAIERENFHAQMDKVIASIDQHLSKLERHKLVEHAASQPVHSKIQKAQVPSMEKVPSLAPVPAQEQAKKSAQPQINNAEKPKTSVRGHNSNLLVGSIVLGVAVILMVILALLGSGPH
jgi:hypothetical protein